MRLSLIVVTKASWHLAFRDSVSVAVAPET